MAIVQPKSVKYRVWATHLVMWGFLALIIFPVIMVIAISFRNGNFSVGEIIPSNPTLDHWKLALGMSITNADGSPLAGVGGVMVKQVGGLNVALIPVAQDTSPEVSNTGDLVFLPTVDSAISAAKQARGDGADLVAREGSVGGIFRQPETALDAPGLGARQIAGDAGYLGVVERLHQDLVIGADQLEGGAHLADGIGLVGQRRTGKQHAQQQRQGAGEGEIVCHGFSFGLPQ